MLTALEEEAKTRKEGEMLRYVSLIAALWMAIPSIALGAEMTWLKFCRAGSTITGLSPGVWACAQPTSNSDYSQVLAVGGCENFDVTISPDRTGDGTLDTGLTYSLRHCPDDNATLDDMTKRDNACVVFSGGSHTASGATLGAGAVYFYVKMGGTMTADSDPQINVRCSQPANF
jgi:hypothetical protein